MGKKGVGESVAASRQADALTASFPHPTGWTPPVPRAILGIGESKSLSCQGTRYDQQEICPPKRRCAGTPASALWAVTLVLGVFVPLLPF